LTKDLAKLFGLNATSGLVVTGVQEGSIAEQSGIKAGDMIEKAGGRAMNSVEDFEMAKTESAGADGLVLDVRSGYRRRFFVVL
jgi:serine protease Do